MDFNLYAYLENQNHYFILRDDLLPFSFGGNKYRKNLNYFEKILEGNYDYVVTYGSKHSNHTRIVANLCAKYNLNTVIITPDSDRNHTFNTKINEALNVELVHCELDKVRETIDNTIMGLQKEGHNCYFIPGGAHGTPGTKAFVQLFDKIISYELEHDLKFDFIFLASGTGTTQAGLIIGNYLNKSDKQIIGISIARNLDKGKKAIEESINEYFNDENLKVNYQMPIVKFYDEYLSGGYGEYNAEIERYINYYYSNFGIPLDTTYTGKAVYGMHNIIEKENIRNKNILFIHTGGTPLFFDYLKEVYQ